MSKVKPLDMVSRVAGATALVWVLFGLGACGAVNTASSIKDAEAFVREAKALDANKNAPYEFTKATQYLRKAKELEGHGFYEHAGAFARRSQLYAEKAQDVARLAMDRQRRINKFTKKRVPAFTPSGE